VLLAEGVPIDTFHVGACLANRDAENHASSPAAQLERGQVASG
jgi:hypothetical protein